MNDDDYSAAGRSANSTELSAAEDQQVFRELEQEEGFEDLLDVPFALKHVKDLHIVMRHAVAVAGDQQEELTHHPLFHPAFAAFVLGFAIGLAQAHRQKHLPTRSASAHLSRRQLELCDEWGAQIATYYLAVVDSEGIFGKDADVDLYGISDRWRLLGEERRLAELDGMQECIELGKRAVREWFDDGDADAPPHFRQALESFIKANPDRAFGLG